MQTHYRLITTRRAALKPEIYSVAAKVKTYQGPAVWYFAVLPKKTSQEIRRRFGGRARGWGSLRVSAKLGSSEWQTSIFPDSRIGAYILPLKAEIRKREGVTKGQTLSMRIAVGAD